MSLGAFNAAGPFETRLFINNEFVNSKSGKTFETINPATEKPIAALQEAFEEDVNAAVESAKAAFEPWRATDPSFKRTCMLKLADLVEANADYLARLESLDNGKPAKTGGYSATGDVALVTACLRYYAGWCEKICGKTIPADGGFMSMTLHEPVGVVGQIIPWNFPLLMLAWKWGPALACGNVIVMKTSEKTPLSALAICKLVVEAGFPAGVINVLSGFGPTAGAAMTTHPDIEKIAFTGSTRSGKMVAVSCAQSNVKKCSLELGGKSPLIIMPDCDLDAAVETAQVGLFLNQGQCCCASSRLFVHEKVYDQFVALAVKKANERKLLDPADPNCDQGPQVDKLQFDSVMSYINKGKAEGAKVAAGGDRHGSVGYYVQPTVFADVTDDMTIAQEEIFGPVMSILKFSSMDEVIRRANATRYGLAAGVMTRDIGTAFTMAKAIRAGTFWINCYDVFLMNAPFGGFKESGTGRELGEYALELYTEVKTVTFPINPAQY